MDHSTLEDLADVYIAERHGRGDFGATTVPGVRWHLRSFCAFAGPAAGPERITPVVVDAWLASEQLARSTLRHRLSWFRGWVRWLIRHGHLAVDPTVDMPRIRIPRPAVRTIAVADVGRIVDQVADDRRMLLIVLLMAQEGLRACEVARAEIGDIDFEVRSIIVRGKGGEQRLLPITDQTWAALTGYVGRSRTSGPLIRSVYRPSEGLTAQYVTILVSKAMAAAGVAGTGHALRHSMAAHVLRAGRGDIRDVQLALGHAHLGTTSIYLPHSDVERLRHVIGGRWYGQAA